MEFICDETPQEIWEALTDHARAPMQQRWIYGAASAALGSDVLRVEIRDNGAPVALVQFISRRVLGRIGVALATRGPVWILPGQPGMRGEIMTALRRALRRHGLRLILFTPDTAADRDAVRDAGLTEIMTPATMARLGTSGDARARMAGKWRNRLTAAEKAGLTERRIEGGFDRHEWLIREDRAQQSRRRYRALPPAFLASWHRIDPGSVLTLSAHDGPTRVAAMLFLIHGNTATYHLGWTGEAGRAQGAHNFLLWRAIRRLDRTRVEDVDLGQIDTENAPGLARFKLGAGATAQELGGTWLGW